MIQQCSQESKTAGGGGAEEAAEEKTEFDGERLRILTLSLRVALFCLDF